MIEELIGLENPIEWVRTVKGKETQFWGFRSSIGGGSWGSIAVGVGRNLGIEGFEGGEVVGVTAILGISELGKSGG
ncbi:hypothetical protein A2U01_0018894 [Trifolium medium]|uniref:Uncharacterized protein n=1 Tax=Trifolium medium TaxID=97028 RepID=A0A392NDF4_9FABA|nr:hypothetical protein [Trifolium medium]